MASGQLDLIDSLCPWLCRSTDSGNYWSLWLHVHNRGDPAHVMRNYPYAFTHFGGFFFQSEVYRRKDGRFLHGARTPVYAVAFVLGPNTFRLLHAHPLLCEDGFTSHVYSSMQMSYDVGNIAQIAQTAGRNFCDIIAVGYPRLVHHVQFSSYIIAVGYPHLVPPRSVQFIHTGCGGLRLSRGSVELSPSSFEGTRPRCPMLMGSSGTRLLGGRRQGVFYFGFIFRCYLSGCI